MYREVEVQSKSLGLNGPDHKEFQKAEPETRHKMGFVATVYRHIL